MADDAEAFADFLEGRPEVADGPIGTTGYRLGGRSSLTVAGRPGSRPEPLCVPRGPARVEDDPASPHHLAGDVRAVVYVAGAENDASFDDEQAERLSRLPLRRRRLLDRHLRGGSTASAVPDNPTFDDAARERHWSAMSTLLAAALR